MTLSSDDRRWLVTTMMTVMREDITPLVRAEVMAAVRDEVVLVARHAAEVFVASMAEDVVHRTVQTMLGQEFTAEVRIARKAGA